MCQQKEKQPFKDLFSSASEKYASFRPQYPPELFIWLSSLVEKKELAWDCATGNGQAAKHLAELFDRVIATDPSSSQLQQAPEISNVEYRCERAESPSIPENSVDLITIAQALHWLEIDSFYEAVNKVLKPGGVISAIAYGLPEITPKIDALIRHLHNEILGQFWAYERRHVINLYRDIPFHFQPIPSPLFFIRATIDQQALLGYLATWSAVIACRNKTGHDPLQLFSVELEKDWPSNQAAIPISWKLACKTGKNR